MPHNDKQLSEKLSKAYDEFLHTAREFIDTTEKEAKPAIQDAVDKTKEKMAEITELTGEEIDKISDYVMRDLHNAAEYIAFGERDLADWLRLDALYIEDRLMEAFSHMVDHTRMALNDIENKAFLASEWRTGEITSMGTLVCEECGEKLHFQKTGHIPPCPKCHHTTFVRESEIKS